MKIYTRSGDDGKTSVIGGRVDKHDIRVATYGTIDELNSFAGLAAAYAVQSGKYADLGEHLTFIQHELFDCGSDLAFIDKGDRVYKVTAGMTVRLESWIDKYEAETQPIRRFILPGGSVAASWLHVCRTVCRRAERLVVKMAKTEEVNPEVGRYLNRLSDFFFMAARAANSREGTEDVEYVRSAEVFREE